MEYETTSDKIRNVINYLEKMNQDYYDILLDYESKKRKAIGGKSSCNYNIKKNNELIQLLTDFIRGCEIVDRSVIFENDIDNNIDYYIEDLNNSLRSGKKILNFKYRYFFRGYNLDEYVEEAFKDFSEFITSANERISREIIRLKNLKKSNNRKVNVDNLPQNVVKKPEVVRKPVNVKINKKEIENFKNQFIETEEQYDTYITSLLGSILNSLEKIDSNVIDNEMQMMYILKKNVSEALYLISISDDDKLLKKRNWLIGVYNSAYNNLCKKYNKMNLNDRNEKSAEFEEKNGFMFDISRYSVDVMIEQFNYYIEKYMLDNKELFQREYNNFETKRVTNTILNCIYAMDDDRIKSLYEKLVFKLRYFPDRYYPDELQHNFVVAVFNLKKSRNEIKFDQELTPEIRSVLINQYGLYDKYMVVTDDFGMSDKKVL